jgi:hypothetical protein
MMSSNREEEDVGYRFGTKSKTRQAEVVGVGYACTWLTMMS